MGQSKREKVIKAIVVIVFLAILSALMYCLFTDIGIAEEHETIWVLCQPDSFVNIREYPSGRSEIGGRAYCGDGFITDGTVKNGFVHVYCSTELGEGWISKHYIVYVEPVYCGEVRHIESKGKVRVRSYVNGKRIGWLKNGDAVKVYWIAEWAVTNKGFINSDFIGAE